MRTGLALLTGMLLMLSLVACNRPTTEDCEEACARMKLLAKADYDQKTADLPEDMARQGWLQAATVIDEMTEVCTVACIDVGDTELTTCLKNAESDEQWKACFQKRR